MKLKNKTTPFMAAKHSDISDRGFIGNTIEIYFFNKKSGVHYYGSRYIFKTLEMKWDVNNNIGMQDSKIRANFGEIENNNILLRKAIQVLFEGEKRKPLY
jgi:cysteine sulfinate desulfinase/cysteine desulfurase-like protein